MEFNKQQFADLLNKAKGDRSINKYGITANVDPGYISRLLRSLIDTAPSATVIKKLADYAHNNVNIEELMSAAGYLPPPQHQADPNIAAIKTIEAAVTDDPELLEFWQEITENGELKLLFKQVRPLSPKALKKVVRVVKAIVEEEETENY